MVRKLYKVILYFYNFCENDLLKMDIFDLMEQISPSVPCNTFFLKFFQTILPTFMDTHLKNI
jgi:hypothetical protein